MGIFTRVRDIVSSNISAMLDRAEDPEKLVRMIIREMEDTLIEVKADCAAAMAASKRVARELEEAQVHAQRWADKAGLALDRGREDLAREALVEKSRYAERVAALGRELDRTSEVVTHYQEDITQLEEKLAGARERQRVLVQRHQQALDRRQAQEKIRAYDTQSAVRRFEEFEQRIDRLEAEGNLVNYARRPTLDEAFASLEQDDAIGRELAALKAQRNSDSPTQQS